MTPEDIRARLEAWAVQGTAPVSLVRWEKEAARWAMLQGTLPAPEMPVWETMAPEERREWAGRMPG